MLNCVFEVWTLSKNPIPRFESFIVFNHIFVLFHIFQVDYFFVYFASVVIAKTFFHLLTEILMTDLRVQLLKIKNSADYTINSFAFKFLFIGIKIFLECSQINIEHNSTMVESFTSFSKLIPEMKPIGRARELHRCIDTFFPSEIRSLRPETSPWIPSPFKASMIIWLFTLR